MVDYWVEKKNKGKSERVKAFGKTGYFDFDRPSEQGDFGELYAFVGDDGNINYRPLEKELAGGRWEFSGQKEEYNPRDIQAMWGDQPVGKRLLELHQEGVAFEALPLFLHSYDTWRSISKGTPKSEIDPKIIMEFLRKLKPIKSSTPQGTQSEYMSMLPENYANKSRE